MNSTAKEHAIELMRRYNHQAAPCVLEALNKQAIIEAIDAARISEIKLEMMALAETYPNAIKGA